MDVDAEVQNALQLLRRAIQLSGLTLARVEDQAGLSRGYLSQLFNGRIELKLRHILLILDTLGIQPLIFFSIALSENSPESEGSKQSEIGDIFAQVMDALGDADQMEMRSTMTSQPVSLERHRGESAEPANLRTLVREVVREVIQEERDSSPQDR
ncbi:MAG: helix-turn-helix transcriptional regulator [Acidobacteriota bacterium]